MNGSEILGRALQRQGADTFFYIMGGPMMAAELATMSEGLRGIDVRHEQAAAMMAHAYARLRNRPGICMAASGPATTNLLTGVAHAWADGVPIIAFGGASPVSSWGTGAFQEMDQLTSFLPCTKWAARAHHPAKVPELVAKAFQQAMSGKPGPVYIDMPGDVLYHDIPDSEIEWPEPWDVEKRSRPAADPNTVQALVTMLKAASQPVIISGSGVLWSEASAEFQAFVEQTGIPFYTTPQSRGAIPEDHDYCYLTARSTAFREADLIIVLGTRMNYVIGHAAPPRFNGDAKIVRIDIDPTELDTSPRALDLGVVGDVRTVLGQLLEATRGTIAPEQYVAWRERLRGRNQTKAAEQEQIISSGDTPIHPLRLCKEIRDFMNRDDVLVVDGQEILNYGRQSIPTFTPAHRMNSGVFGTMGVGLPFGVGAKVAKPDARVIVLHGDGSFGMNAMEMDTSVRHDAPVLIVISLNGGWTGDPDKEKPGRDLGYTRFDQMAEALGAAGELVEDPDEIRPALERAAAKVAAGQTALVNVVTDWRARATTAAFTRYVT
ncbi:MAG: thiamine pyrophosphate-binding protein [Pseudomonadota bacterium]